MVRISSSIEIFRPVAQVFAFISSSANEFEWKYGTLASVQISEGAGGVGASFRTVGHLMGRRMVSTFEVTEFEANHQYGYKSLSGPLDSHTKYTVEAGPGGTRLQVVTHASSRDASAPLDGFMERHMQKELNDNLSMLKTVLEGKQVLGAASLTAFTPALYRPVAISQPGRGKE